MIILLILTLFLFSCSDDDNPTGTLIEVSEGGKESLTEASHTADDRYRSTIRADKDTVLVVIFRTLDFNVNASDKWFDADKSWKHGVYLYYRVQDGIEIVAVGGGRIVDGFLNSKTLIQPREAYRHLAQLDSVWFHNNGTSLFYTNYVYFGDVLPVKVGKVKMEGSAILKIGNVLLTKEKLFALRQQGLRE